MRRPFLARTARRLSLIKGIAAALLLTGAALNHPAPACSGALACEPPSKGGLKAAAGGALEIPGDKPHLLEFTSESCPACARMAPLVAELERRCTEEDGTVLRVDVESTGGEALAERFRVKKLPTFVSVDAGGHEVERHEGVMGRERLATALTELRGRACPAL